MTKFAFILSLLFTLSTAVLYGSTSKPEFSQGYRYSRPAPHYLPPHQESTTQTSSYYPSSHTQSSWSGSSSAALTDVPSYNNNVNSYQPSASSSSSTGYNYLQPQATTGWNFMKPEASSGYNYAAPKPEASSGYNYAAPKPEASSGYNYVQPKPEASSGYNYPQPEGSSLSTSLRPSSGYNYEKPQATNVKPSSNYLPPYPSSMEIFRPTNNYLPPKPTNTYIPPKPSTSYIPAASSSSSGYDYSQPQPSIPIFEAYKPSEGYIYMKPQASAAAQYQQSKPTEYYDDFGPSFSSSSATGPSPVFQRPQVPSYNNNYSSMSSSYPSNSYLPPKREFETPYY